MEQRIFRSLSFLVIIAILGGLISALVRIYPNLLWFQMVGYDAIYSKILLTRIFVGGLVGLIFLILTLGNLYLIWRLAPSKFNPEILDAFPLGSGLDFDLRKLVYAVLVLLACAYSALSGYSASDRWEIFLRYFDVDTIDFHSSTRLSQPSSGNTVTIPRADFEAKGMQVGDLVKIKTDQTTETATIQKIQTTVDTAQISLDRSVGNLNLSEAILLAPTYDPILNKPIGFYVFRMPFLRFICGSLLGLFFLMTLVTGVIYFFHGALFSDRNQLEPPPKVKAHLFTLIGLILVIYAWQHRFMMYDLLYMVNNKNFKGGSGYAAIHARLPLLRIMMGLSVVSGLTFFISLFFKPVRYALGGLGALLLVGVLGNIYPSFVQELRVNPNAQDLETEYINYNIKATLQAYNLGDDTVTEKEYPLDSALSYDQIYGTVNQQVIRNIRLWDWRPLRRTYRQLQELRPQYDFVRVGVDRYRMKDGLQQVMLSARELNIDDMAEIRRDWFKRTYVYTHGYGVVMSPVSETNNDGISDNGKPKMYIRDINPINFESEWSDRFSTDFEPRIYYGEAGLYNNKQSEHYVITHPTGNKTLGRKEDLEFDYPLDQQRYQKYAYQGKGGVELSSLWRRIIYAIKFNNEIKFVVKGPITPQSRVLYHRNILSRVRKIAPFLHYDRDPYLVVHGDRLVWMIDAYTTTYLYPYATPMQHGIRAAIAERQGIRQARRLQTRPGEKPWGNYIRNSVKVTIDAYDGVVDFYLMDDKDDPLALGYKQIFPDLLKPISAMPTDLRHHIRYPMTLFSIQAKAYLDYHMKDPTTFYAKEDQWQVGQEIYSRSSRRTVPTPTTPSQFGLAPTMPVQDTVSADTQEVAPYYVIVKVPGEEKAEFVLMLPFTPKDKPNLTAWMAARCDPEHYGQLLLYRFPKGKLASGPMQVESFIDQKGDISQQISLWNTQGSRVLRGNLLVIPISDSLLYVEPIYIQSENEDAAIPELRRVVVGYKEKVEWGETLDQALRKLFNITELPLAEATDLVDSTESALISPTNSTMTGDDEGAGANFQGYARLIKQANANFKEAIQAQRVGNWSVYGQKLDQLKQILKRLEQMSN